jgi:hypothetical protein
MRSTGTLFPVIGHDFVLYRLDTIAKQETTIKTDEMIFKTTAEYPWINKIFPGCQPCHLVDVQFPEDEDRDGP